MVFYQYAVIQQRGTAIELQITDSSTIHQLLDKLSALIEGFGASASKLPGGDPYYWRLYGLGESVDSAWALIVDHFVSQGWQSLDDQHQDANRTVCFGRYQDTRCRETIRDPVLCISLA